MNLKSENISYMFPGIKILLSLHSREEAAIALQAVGAEMQRESQRLFWYSES